jgi:hypothetical protein
MKKARPKPLFTMLDIRLRTCFIQSQSSSRCSHFSASLRSSIMMFGSCGDVEHRRRILLGPQCSSSSLVCSFTPWMSSYTVSTEPLWRRNRSIREGNRPSSLTEP